MMKKCMLDAIGVLTDSQKTHRLQRVGRVEEC